MKGTCVTLRKRVDRLAHALIGLTTAVSEVRCSSPIKFAAYSDMFAAKVTRAIAEADSVLASEQSAA